MPLILLVVLAAFGVGYYVEHNTCHHCPYAEMQAAPDEIAPADTDDVKSSWAAACEERLSETAEAFAQAQGLGCNTGDVTVERLPSGVEYVEYKLHMADGSDFSVAVTEEPQNAGETPGWHGAPGCKGYDHGFETVRHENGHLARVFASGAHGFEFAQAFESAADFCVVDAE